MRKVYLFSDQNIADHFVYSAQQKGIACHVEEDPEGILLWVEKEEDVEKTKLFLARFLHAPHKYKRPPLFVKKPDKKEQVSAPVSSLQFLKSYGFVTRIIIVVVIGFYLVNLFETPTGLGFTPLQEEFLFEDPVIMQQAQMMWPGFYNIFAFHQPLSIYQSAPMFVSIAQGEIWRLVTPSLLHGSFFHILFNLLWFWMLGRSLEDRAGILKYCLLLLSGSIVTNVCQYLMSGFLFLGLSGVVAVQAGFIWIRQKIAPWERFLVPRQTLNFLIWFILALLALQLVFFVLQFLRIVSFQLPIANTAHVTGFLWGVGCGFLPIFKGK